MLHSTLDAFRGWQVQWHLVDGIANDKHIIDSNAQYQDWKNGDELGPLPTVNVADTKARCTC